MKACPFCAEEIQDAAVVCKHCGKTLTKAKKKKDNSALVVFGVLGAVALLIVLAVASRSTSNAGEPLLNISAAKGALSLSITNREAGAISDCRFTLLDQGDDEWVANVSGPIASFETVRVEWSEFKANGQPMPAHIGQNRRNFTFSCAVEGVAARRSGGIAF